MQIINPTKNNTSTFEQILRWAQSVYKATQGALGIARPVSQAASGVFNAFSKDNLDCVLLYIGANGSGAPISWGATNVGQAINHTLLRQPIGFVVVYKDKTCDVYSTATPTSDVITLAITDDTANTIIMVF